MSGVLYGRYSMAPLLGPGTRNRQPPMPSDYISYFCGIVTQIPGKVYFGAHFQRVSAHRGREGVEAVGWWRVEEPPSSQQGASGIRQYRQEAKAAAGDPLRASRRHPETPHTTSWETSLENKPVGASQIQTPAPIFLPLTTPPPPTEATSPSHLDNYGGPLLYSLQTAVGKVADA